MIIYHWPSPEGNFGDDINLWIWNYLFPGIINNNTDVTLLGIGTVLDAALVPAEYKKLVVGSGAGYGQTPNISDNSMWDIRCVRGPLTAKKLGVDKKIAIIDPAVLVSDLQEFSSLNTSLGTIFVPHWESAVSGCWDIVCREAGVKYVDPCSNSKEVIKSIAQASLVIAESMHAAIIADAFRVPWIPVSTSKKINSFKWKDWLASLKMDYMPYSLPVSTPLEASAKGQKYFGFRWPVSDFDNSNEKSLSDRESIIHNNANNLIKTKLKSALSSPSIGRALAVPSVYKLKQVAKMKPQLSNQNILNNQKLRLLSLLEQIKIDYSI